MIRAPAVAGSFYALEKEELRRQINSCFTSELGPGFPTIVKGKKTKPKKLIAAVVPHAGYAYSGPIAAHVYKRIAESQQASTYVILGPNHTGVGAGVSIMVDGLWATPLGQARINSELAMKIADACSSVEVDESAHFHEHSIEVQIPFLQFVQKKFEIVPICMMMQDPGVAEEIGIKIAEICKQEKKENVTVLASSDFTHFEPHPSASEKDNEAIDAVLELDTKEFYDVLMKHNMSVCGYGPIAVAMNYAKELGVKSGRILKYSTSGDVTGDKTSVVGYASISFE